MEAAEKLNCFIADLHENPPGACDHLCALKREEVLGVRLVTVKHDVFGETVPHAAGHQ